MLFKLSKLAVKVASFSFLRSNNYPSNNKTHVHKTTCHSVVVCATGGENIKRRLILGDNDTRINREYILTAAVQLLPHTAKNQCNIP